MDLFLDEMMPPDSKVTAIRMPDKPTRAHFDQLGDAYPMKDDKGKDIYDENQFGLIVLDECLTWLNSRGWQDKERVGVLDWFLHARKHGWNIAFIMQSADYCDPQLRETLLTYHISCRKMGKYRIPIVGKAFGLRLPKGPLATTTAGYGSNAIDHDKELYRGSDLYTSYKTRQVFTLEQDLINGVFVDMRAPYTLLVLAFKGPLSPAAHCTTQSGSTTLNRKTDKRLRLVVHPSGGFIGFAAVLHLTGFTDFLFYG